MLLRNAALRHVAGGGGGGFPGPELWPQTGTGVLLSGFTQQAANRYLEDTGPATADLSANALVGPLAAGTYRMWADDIDANGNALDFSIGGVTKHSFPDLYDGINVQWREDIVVAAPVGDVIGIHDGGGVWGMRIANITVKRIA